MTIRYYTKQVYGNTLRYLVTKPSSGQEDLDDAALALLALIGAKTISLRQMELCEHLGLKFERTFEPEA